MQASVKMQSYEESENVVDYCALQLAGAASQDTFQPPPG